MRAVARVFEFKALRDHKLELEHGTFRLRHRSRCWGFAYQLGRKGGDGKRVVFRFGRQVEACEPASDREEGGTSALWLPGPCTTRLIVNERGYSHDVLGMPIHACIPDIKAFHIRHRRGLHKFRQPKRLCELSDLDQVERHERQLVRDG